MSRSCLVVLLEFESTKSYLEVVAASCHCYHVLCHTSVSTCKFWLSYKSKASCLCWLKWNYGCFVRCGILRFLFSAGYGRNALEVKNVQEYFLCEICQEKVEYEIGKIVFAKQMNKKMHKKLITSLINFLCIRLFL